MCLQWSLKLSNTCKSEMKSGYFWVSARHTDGDLRQQRRVNFASVPGLKNVVCCWWRYEPCTNVHSRKQPKGMGTEDFLHQRLSVSLPDLLGTVWEMCHLRGEGFSCEMWWIGSPECPKGDGGRQQLSSLDAAACPESLHLGDLQWLQRHHRSLQRCEIPVMLKIFFPLLHVIGQKLWRKLYKMNSWGLWLAIGLRVLHTKIWFYIEDGLFWMDHISSSSSSSVVCSSSSVHFRRGLLTIPLKQCLCNTLLGLPEPTCTVCVPLLLLL